MATFSLICHTKNLKRKEKQQMKISDSNVNVVTLSCRAHFFRSPCMMEMALTCDPTKVSIRETEQLKQPAVGAFRLV